MRSGRISESISDKADKRYLEAGKHCEFNPTGFCEAVVNINLNPLAFKWCTSHEVLKSNSEEQRSGMRLELVQNRETWQETTTPTRSFVGNALSSCCDKFFFGDFVVKVLTDIFEMFYFQRWRGLARRDAPAD